MWNTRIAVDVMEAGRMAVIVDADEACETVTANGGTVLMPPMDTPPGRAAAVMDPAGAAFSVIALNEVPS